MTRHEIEMKLYETQDALSSIGDEIWTLKERQEKLLFLKAELMEQLTTALRKELAS